MKTWSYKKTLVSAHDNDGENPIMLYVETFDDLAVVFLDGVEDCGRLILAVRGDKMRAIEQGVLMANEHNLSDLIALGKANNKALGF